MEKLNSDEKILILQHLNLKDILQLCGTCKFWKNVLFDVRYDNFWCNKIKTDFNVTHKHKYPFIKYKQLYHKQIYEVSSYNYHYGEYDKYPIIFSTYTDAKNYIHNTIYNLDHNDSCLDDQICACDRIYDKYNEVERSLILHNKYLYEKQGTKFRINKIIPITMKLNNKLQNHK